MEQTIKTLRDLMQLDYDAVLAYTRAIDGIEPQYADIRTRLGEFRDDHERHIRELSDVIVALGGTPPERARDFKGVLIEGMTAVESAMGTEWALRAMRTNEKLTNKRYEHALELELPPEVSELIRRNYDDEQRHLAWIIDALDRRVWEPMFVLRTT
jgi:rubrerythrin